jgi:hypothetical protein
MGTDEIAREKRLRRAAVRQGLRLSKSARRDPRASDYGKYRVENPNLREAIVAGGAPSESSAVAGRGTFDYTLDLDGVEAVLFPNRHGGRDHPLARDEDFENAITPHAPHDGNWHRDHSD